MEAFGVLSTPGVRTLKVVSHEQPQWRACAFEFMLYPSPVAQLVKNLPAVWETLGQEDPLEMGMATHSSILAWRIP